MSTSAWSDHTMDFTRLTESAQQTLDGAYREARRLDHRVIQPEHLMLGLVMNQSRGVARILRSFRVDSKQVRLRVERTLEPGEPLDTSTFELAVRTRRIIRFAEEEASDLGQFGVEDEHLLLALLAEEHGIPRQVLNEMGLTYAKVRAHLDDRLRARQAAQRPLKAFYSLSDFLREPFRLAARRSPPVELSLVFIGIVLATVLFGVLLYLRVLPVLSLILFVTGGWIISLCLHEFGHALVAYVGGDSEVYYKGYLSLNPIKYAHPVLSIVLPLIFLLLGGIGLPGGAVYINRHAIYDKRMHSLTSAAGPIATLLCAVVLLIPFVTGLAYVNTAAHLEFWAGLALLAVLEITGIVLNLLPFPGLDGFGIIEPFLPPRLVETANILRQFTFLFILALFLSPLAFVFWSVVRFISSLVNLDYGLVIMGLGLFRFWL
jgi:Zn-dependent protease